MDIKFFNDGYGFTPAEYAKLLFENTNENMLTLSRRNEDPFSDEYEKQHFESYTINWDKNDLQNVIEDFEILYSELEGNVGIYETDCVVQCLELQLEDEMVDCRVRRLFRLFELGAPQSVIDCEGCRLIDAMIIARYAVSLDFKFQFADDFKVA